MYNLIAWLLIAGAVVLIVCMILAIVILAESGDI